MDLMSWTSWLIILLAWLAIGLGVAYMFGRFARGAEAPDSAGSRSSLVVWFVRYIKRAEPPLQTPTFPHTQTRFPHTQTRFPRTQTRY